jgi:2-desacetyl-2-hydroxyethyl bacteriochlorophyllide A dehydrogenase
MIGAMRAVRLLSSNAPLQIQELEEPRPGRGEVKVAIRAAGICHSDAHYRQGGRVHPPLTLGHEIAGTIDVVGEGVTAPAPGQRVALHYLLPDGAMLGKERDGGYAEKIVVPADNCLPIPDEVPFEQAAIMMCSTATVYHALRLAGLQRGESVAILGFGGLGVSAIQIARHYGASRVFAVDVVPEKLAAAETLGAMAIDARDGDLASALRGIDVALDFAGNAETALAALRALAPGGRLMLVAINLPSLLFDPYADLLVKERRIIGVSDHTREELVDLLELARRGAIDLSSAVTRTVPLDATPINRILDELESGTPHLRTVISIAD